MATLSLVSCSVSPRRRNTKYRFLFLLDFVVHFCTCSQTVFCDRQFLPAAMYCTLWHRENGSFEVLSLHIMCVAKRCCSMRQGVAPLRLRNLVVGHNGEAALRLARNTCNLVTSVSNIAAHVKVSKTAKTTINVSAAYLKVVL